MRTDDFRLPDGIPIFGFPDEWAFFRKEHPQFVDALETLAVLQQKLMKRTFTPTSPAEELVFFSGSLVQEDFPRFGSLRPTVAELER